MGHHLARSGVAERRGGQGQRGHNVGRSRREEIDVARVLRPNRLHGSQDGPVYKLQVDLKVATEAGKKPVTTEQYVGALVRHVLGDAATGDAVAAALAAREKDDAPAEDSLLLQDEYLDRVRE